MSAYPDTFRMARTSSRSSGHLDILVNNAGINSDKTFVKMDHASWRRCSRLTSTACSLHKSVHRQMLKQSYGRVVTSPPSSVRSATRPGNYAASKAGVAAFTKSLAKELAGKGSR